MQTHYMPEDQFPLPLNRNIIIFGNYYFNLYLVKGQNKTALFEVGISAIVDRVISQLKSLDIQLDYIIPSHPHADHMTGLPGLKKAFPKAEIIVASGAKKFLEHPKALQTIIHEDRFMSKSLANIGITPERPPLNEIPDLENSLVVDKKYLLNLGDINLELIRINGHSPGNLMGVVKEKNAVFCSDSIGFHFPGRHFLPLFFTGVDPYMSTLKYIREMQPSILCPAHQGPITGNAAKQNLDKTWKTTLEFIDHIKSSEFSDEALAKQIFEKNYVDEFTLYSKSNILNCCALLVKRAKEATPHE